MTLADLARHLSAADDKIRWKACLGAFTLLGDRLVRRGVVTDLFVGGGAAMALAYDATPGDPRR